MSAEKPSREMKDNLQIVRSLVSRFPIGCACYQTLTSDVGDVADYLIVGVNAEFEKLSGTKREQLTGKKITEAFRSVKPEAIARILELGNRAYQNRTKNADLHISVFNRAYKVSFLYISDSLVLGLYQAVSAQSYHKLYRHTIPYEVIARSLSERLGRGNRREMPAERAAEADGQSPLSILDAEVAPSNAEDLMFRDALTGLYDRLFALSALQMYLERGAVPASVVLGDINGLSMVNEAAGYAAGDDLLVQVARTLKSQCRAEDIIARWGDDEFLIILPYTAERETQRLLKRLQTALDTQCAAQNCTLVTFGYATAEDDMRTAQELIREAEKWVYRKKLLVQQSYRSGILRLLLSTLHEKSAETEEHSGRMTNYCRKIAAVLQLSNEAANDLVLLSMLHDIGKIGVRHEILAKPGPLTPEERREIEQHPEIGYRIARNIPELTQVAKYILAHHERWDGGGYPKGLRGEEIPLASRIVAVADAFDVMISGRPYRAARSEAEALEELERCSGTQFDPEIVKIMVGLHRAPQDENVPAAP